MSRRSQSRHPVGLPSSESAEGVLTRTVLSPMVPAMAKPPITANQVTLLRLVLLPIGGVLMYSGTTGLWAALVFMTLLGCTDFVDGWLARRYGSTELGR